MVDLTAILVTQEMHYRIRRLPLIHLALIGAEMVLVALLLIIAFVKGEAAAQAARDIVIEPYSIVFWVLIVLLGFIVSFAVHAYAADMGQHSALSDLDSGADILLAGLFLSYLIIVSSIPIFLQGGSRCSPIIGHVGPLF